MFAWHDCDPGYDDALALAMLTASEKITNMSLIGVSTVGGNVDVAKCTINARRMLAISNHPNTNVFTGASRPLIRTPIYCPEVHGETGLDGTTTLEKVILPPLDEKIYGTGKCIKAMYTQMMATPKGSCWLVCTGPLTNAAILLSTYGEKFAGHLAGLCFMGGAI